MQPWTCKPAWLGDGAAVRAAAKQSVLFPNTYAWLIFMAAMDAILTWAVLYLGGREVNPIAELVIVHRGFLGVVGFKFCLVLLFVIICEAVGRSRIATGQRLAIVGVAICAAPVVWTLGLLAAYFG